MLIIQDNNGLTPLSYAAQHGYASVAKRLLKVKGIDVNIQDNNGLTPLHLALQYENSELVNLLLAKGANIEGALEPLVKAYKEWEKKPAQEKIDKVVGDIKKEATANKTDKIEDWLCKLDNMKIVAQDEFSFGLMHANITSALQYCEYGSGLSDAAQTLFDNIVGYAEESNADTKKELENSSSNAMKELKEFIQLALQDCLKPDDKRNKKRCISHLIDSSIACMQAANNPMVPTKRFLLQNTKTMLAIFCIIIDKLEKEITSERSPFNDAASEVGRQQSWKCFGNSVSEARDTPSNSKLSNTIISEVRLTVER